MQNIGKRRERCITSDHRCRIVTLPEAVLTSARRWQPLGVVRTTLINQVMIVGFLSGIPTRTLRRLYIQTRKPG